MWRVRVRQIIPKQHRSVVDKDRGPRAPPQRGKVVVAYFVGEAMPDELDKLCLERIARFKRPKDYVQVMSLPKNNDGKVVKTELRAIHARRDVEVT